MNKINDVCAQARPQRTMFAMLALYDEILGTARHGTALQTSGIRV